MPFTATQNILKNKIIQPAHPKLLSKNSFSGISPHYLGLSSNASNGLPTSTVLAEPYEQYEALI